MGRMCPRTGSVHHFRLNIIIGHPPREGLKFAFDINVVTGTVCSIRQSRELDETFIPSEEYISSHFLFCVAKYFTEHKFLIESSALMHFNLSWQSLLEATIPPDLAAVLM